MAGTSVASSHVPSLRFNEAVSIVSNSIRSAIARADALSKSTPVCLLGPPGIGKTSMGLELARHLSEADGEPWLVEVRDLSSTLPEDINGLPYRDEGVTRYAPQSWLARLCKPGVKGILILDDLPVATPAVQVATRQLILQRTAGDARLSENVFIIVTGNRREDKSAASTLPAHFVDCVNMIDITISLDEWCSWYGKQKNLDPVIPAFLRFRDATGKHAFSLLPKDADGRGKFATPRSWTKLGAEFANYHKLGKGMVAACGHLHEGIAHDFMAFVTLRAELVDPGEVLLDPEGVLPNPASYLNTPDRAYALITGIAETAAAWVSNPQHKHAKKAPELFMAALGHCSNGNREYIPVSVSNFTANGGTIKMLSEAYKQTKGNPKVKAVIDYLAEVVRSGGSI